MRLDGLDRSRLDDCRIVLRSGRRHSGRSQLGLMLAVEHSFGYFRCDIVGESADEYPPGSARADVILYDRAKPVHAVLDRISRWSALVAKALSKSCVHQSVPDMLISQSFGVISSDMGQDEPERR